MTTRIQTGSVLAHRELTAIDGTLVSLPDPQWITHLQFRRFAGCPWCSLHLNSVAARYEEIQAAGVREIAVFNSSAADLLAYEGGMPFPVVADPSRRLYTDFGVDRSPRSLLSPHAWRSGVRGLRAQYARPAGSNGRHRPLAPGMAALGLPVDLLIAPDGRVLARHDGTHAGDQWSVTELLARVGALA
ncbi:MAG: redoxin domain-containing protein [Actinobacteria bacterium]|nr:redoxin domain-containing protein [Actinomycetota bacterium]